jgi:hypothetical protein
MIENGTFFAFKIPVLTDDQRNEERNKSKHRRADDFMAKEYTENYSNNEDISIDFEMKNSSRERLIHTFVQK